MAVTSLGQPVAAISPSASSGSFSSFTPNAGSSYYIQVAAASNGSGSPAATITGIAFASGGTITRVAQFRVDNFSQEESIWEIKPGNGGTGAITVTGNAAVTGIFASICEFTGVATGTTIGATANNGQTGTSCQLAVTPNQTGSLILYVLQDSFESFTPTANGSSTILASGQAPAGAENVTIIGNANTSAGVSYTTGVTNTGTSGGPSMLVAELLPAPPAAAGAAARPGQTWRRQFKHRQQPQPLAPPTAAPTAPVASYTRQRTGVTPRARGQFWAPRSQGQVNAPKATWIQGDRGPDYTNKRGRFWFRRPTGQTNTPVASYTRQRVGTVAQGRGRFWAPGNPIIQVQRPVASFIQQRRGVTPTGRGRWWTAPPPPIVQFARVFVSYTRQRVGQTPAGRGRWWAPRSTGQTNKPVASWIQGHGKPTVNKAGKFWAPAPVPPATVARPVASYIRQRTGTVNQARGRWWVPRSQGLTNRPKPSWVQGRRGPDYTARRGRFWAPAPLKPRGWCPPVIVGRKYIPPVNRGRYWMRAPVGVVVVPTTFPPYTVTASDRPAVGVTGLDAGAATAAGSDRPTVGVTGVSTTAATLTALDTAAVNVTSTSTP